MRKGDAYKTLTYICTGRRTDRTNQARDYVRESLLDDLRSGLIATREQLMSRRDQLAPRLMFARPEYLDEFLEAIWETYQDGDDWEEE